MRTSDSRLMFVNWLLLVWTFVSVGGLRAQVRPDVKDSSDHPLFPNRMPGYSISNYQRLGFTSYRFRTRPPQIVEVKHTRIHYDLDDSKLNPGGLAIHRNYENAIKAAGGEVVFSDNNVSVMKAVRNGVEVWAELQASIGYTSRLYFLNIVEREAMEQAIKADAMAAAIDKDGFVALDIHFATGKAEILPESRPTIDEIVSMLKQRPSLKVGVEGHTDNTGTPATNKTLSEARAKSVADAVATAGISPERVQPAGFGQERPIADNRTEQGRAQNRRVEIVKK